MTMSTCAALSLARSALAGSEFARDAFWRRYGVPQAVWTAEPAPEPEQQALPRTRTPRPLPGLDPSPASRVATAIEALETGDQALAVTILVDLEADLYRTAA